MQGSKDPAQPKINALKNIYNERTALEKNLGGGLDLAH